MQPPEDSQLVIDYRAGDHDALEILIQRYLKPVYHFMYRMVGTIHDAEDMTQETFVKAWKNLKRFDTRKNFKTWLFRIAKNTALDFLKRKKAIPFSAFENAEGENVLANTIADPEPLPSVVFDRTDLALVLVSVLAKLPPMYRAVLTLRYNEQLNFREIAEVLDEPLHTIKSRHRRACMMLKELLITAPNNISVS